MASNSLTSKMEKVNSEKETLLQQINSQLKEENNNLKKQLKETKQKEEEYNSLKIDMGLLKSELHQLILNNNKEEMEKKKEEYNLLKTQIQTLIEQNAEDRKKREEEIKLLKTQISGGNSKKKTEEEMKKKILTLKWNLTKEDYGPASKEHTWDIYDAVRKGLLPAVKFHYNQNPKSINEKCRIFHNFTPLIFAAENGNLEIVKFLISKDAEINPISSGDGSNALIIASRNGHTAIINLLLDSGADINYQTFLDKDTALHAAVLADHLDCVKLLIERGAEKTLRNNDLENPLEMARKMNKTEIVEYLTSI